MIEANPIFAVGLMVLFGLIGGLLIKKVKLPMVTGYVITGILISPALWRLLGLHPIISENLLTGDVSLALITDIGLGIIGYMIGGGLKLSELKGMGKVIGFILFFQAGGAVLLTTLLLIPSAHFLVPGLPGINYDMAFALLIGTMSCATAPAATIAIVHEYRAKGPLTTTLLAVVAIDDAFALIAYAIGSSISASLTGITSLSATQMLSSAVIEIFGSLALGLLFGFILVYIAKATRTRERLLVWVLGFLTLVVGLSLWLNSLLGISLSYILSCMAVGFVVTNFGGRERGITVIQQIEDVVFVIFFVFAGMNLELESLAIAGLIALIITLSRCSGKYFGVRVGGYLSKAPMVVRKYLGFALLPKAGVTIGLALLASRSFPLMGGLILNAVLASTIINELIAPPFTKYALFKANEANV